MSSAAVRTEDQHARHVAAGVWSNVCVMCGMTDATCRWIEGANSPGRAASIFADLPETRRAEVLRRLGERNRVPAALVERLRGTQTR